MDFSIVIPTRNEKKNVSGLLERISMALQAVRHEIIVVDDSTDDTPVTLKKLAIQYPALVFYHRANMHGLGSAVVMGFRKSRGKYLAVLDADLQHPPEILPVLLGVLQRGSDIAIPSRFVTGGSDGGLKPYRKLVSLTARTLARSLLPRVRPVRDCTSGCFALHRKVIEAILLDPVSWKILIEILVRGNYQTVTEIPYHFTARASGESKLNLQEQWEFLRHLLKLRKSKPPL